MNHFEEIEKLANSEIVQLGESFRELLHKKLCLGMTRHVARWGTLSDGHNKITPAQRYFQAIKEMYHLSMSIKDQEVNAMEAKADLLDAERELESCQFDSDKLRAQAKAMRAKNKIIQAATQANDNIRVLDEFNKVRKELEPEVMAKYPEGIEQSESDNWIATAEYQSMLRKLGLNQMMTNIPLSPEDKARVGIETGNMDLAAWDIVSNKKEIMGRFDGSVAKYLENKFGESAKRLLGGKDG